MIFFLFCILCTFLYNFLQIWCVGLTACRQNGAINRAKKNIDWRPDWQRPAAATELSSGSWSEASPAGWWYFPLHLLHHHHPGGSAGVISPGRWDRCVCAQTQPACLQGPAVPVNTRRVTGSSLQAEGKCRSLVCVCVRVDELQ